MDRIRQPASQVHAGRCNLIFSIFSPDLMVCEDGTILKNGIRPAKQHMGKNGYLVINHSRDGKSRMLYVHRLVAGAYCKGYKAGLVVNHLNGDKLDNRPDNLEWCTQADNIYHAIRNGAMSQSGSGEMNGSAKFKDADISNMISDMKNGMTQKEACAKYGVSGASASRIKNGTAWRHLSR